MVSAPTIGKKGNRLGDVTVDLDTRLVAAVHAAAGARCHTAANLVQAYYWSAEVCNMALEGGNAAAVRDARRMLQDAKVRLRDFLARQLLGLIAATPERRHNADHPVNQTN